MNKVINISTAKSSCAVCGFSDLCLPHGLKKEEWKLLEGLIQQEHTLEKGDPFFYSGQAFKSLFAVHSGSIKTFILTNDGDEQVIGFHMPGDILGFDALGEDVHSCTAVALETSKGNLGLALGLGVVLIGLAVLVNGAVMGLRGSARRMAYV